MRLGKLRRRQGGVIDRRGQGSGFGFGAGSSLPGGRGGLGLGLIVLVLALIFGGTQLLGDEGGGISDVLGPFGDTSAVQPGSSGTQVDPDDPAGDFVDAVADDVQVTWVDLFERSDLTYEETSVVLFDGATSSACGRASSATGPFYCPADRLVYIDLEFFRELERRFGAPGDFAQAYVIAHEIGHHVQNLLGIDAQVARQTRADPSRANDLSIRLELQADCFAGVWGRAAQGAGILEPGDLEEGMTAAAAVGDDRIQEAATGRIDPESWTHGSSEQRTTWFRTGFQIGNPDACDTFSQDL